MKPAADEASYIIYGPKQTWTSQLYLEGLHDATFLLDDPQTTSNDQKVTATMKVMTNELAGDLAKHSDTHLIIFVERVLRRR